MRSPQESCRRHLSLAGRLGGAYLAAYLDYWEPSQRLIRGKPIDSYAKPFRGVSFGSAFKNGAYNIEQGKIEGTDNRRDRFFIANELK